MLDRSNEECNLNDTRLRFKEVNRRGDEEHAELVSIAAHDCFWKDDVPSFTPEHNPTH